MGNPHDDRAWPRGALPASVIVAVAGIGIGTMVAIHEQRTPVTIAFVIGVIVGAWLLISGMTRWLRGEPFPAALGGVAVVVSVPALVIFFSCFDRATGGVFVAGLATGCMLANVWAIRAARRNRPTTR